MSVQVKLGSSPNVILIGEGVYWETDETFQSLTVTDAKGDVVAEFAAGSWEYVADDPVFEWEEDDDDA